VTIHYSVLPGLHASVHRKTSDPAADENCIAHTLGARGEWWEPIIGRFWPLGPPFYNHRVESLVHLYERNGFDVCDSADLESGFDKVAIYGNDGEYTHAARQLPDGTWTSKLGPEDDINHATLDALAGGEYGHVIKIMRRRSNLASMKCCEDQEGR
jgi:hypothetical protein